MKIHRFLLLATLFSNLVALLYSTFILHTALLDFRSRALHLPAEGFFWIDSNFVRSIFAWGLVLGALYLIQKMRMFFSFPPSDEAWQTQLYSLGGFAVLTGGIGLILQIMTTEQRLVFGYFPSLSLIAVGIGLRIRSHVPNLLLIVLLYFSAATHKAFNFSKMRIYIPEAISARIPVELERLDPSTISLVPTILSYIVIPLEYSMALLLLFPKTRFVGFFLALLFHTLVSTLTNNADGLATVGLFVLIGHAGLFVLSDQRTFVVEKQPTPPEEVRLFLSAVFITSFFGALTMLGFEEGGRAGFQRAIFYYSAFAAIVIAAKVHARVSFDAGKERLLLMQNPFLRIWVLFLVAWSIYPASIGYRNQQFGWAMMSGASSGKPVKCLVIESNSCVSELDLDPVAGVYPGPTTTVIASRQPAYFEKIIGHIESVCQSRVHFRGEAYRDQTIKCRPSTN